MSWKKQTNYKELKTICDNTSILRSIEVLFEKVIGQKKMLDIYKKHPKLFFAFSEKNDGSMKLLRDMPAGHSNFRNREKYLQKIGISPSRLVSAEIVHGGKIAEVSAKDAGRVVAGVDGLITREKNLFLSVTTADCLPIFLFEPKKEIVGMIHAGWRSLEKNILMNVIDKIAELDGNPVNILVGIGPAICQKHYEVGPEVAEKFAKYPGAIKKESNIIFLDIKKVAYLQFLELGLQKENIEISPECTFEMPEKYFSARRNLPRTDCPVNNDSKLQRIDKPDNQQLARGEPKEIEAMIAVIGMKA